MSDVSQLSYRELLKQRAALEAAIESARNGERQKAIEEINAKMLEYDIRPAELGKRSGAGKPKGNAVAARYRDPVSGNTWSGRGKPPLWIAGRDREQFAVEA